MNVFIMMCGLFFSSIVFSIPLDVQKKIPLAPAIPIIDPITIERTFYLDKNTSSSINDGSALNPWKTFKEAAVQLSAKVSEVNPIGDEYSGVKLIVKYSSTPYDLVWPELFRSDTNKEWIVIEGENRPDNEKVAFTGRMLFGGYDQEDETAHYTKIQNVKFVGPGGSGLNVVIKAFSHDLIFEDVDIDCEFSTDSSRGISVGNDVKRVWFKDVSVYGCGFKYSNINTSTGIYVGGKGIDQIVFDNVNTSYNKGDGVGGVSETRHGRFYFNQCISDHNEGDAYDMSGSLVFFNDTFASNNGGGQGAGFKIWSKESWLVRSVAYNNFDMGANIKPLHIGENNSYILNSTFSMNSANGYGGQIVTHFKYPEDGDLFLYLHNNIFHTLNTSAINIENDTKEFIKEESHNYYFSEFDDSFTSIYGVTPNNRHWTEQYALFFRDGTGYTGENYFPIEMAENGAWSNNYSYIDSDVGTGNLGEISSDTKTDPGFVNARYDDLHLSSESDAINGGIDLGFLSDTEGNLIVNNPDIGAYEYTDTDNDTLQNYIDTDDDNDGVSDSLDNCPLDVNIDQVDFNSDGIGDICDPDGDGLSNIIEIVKKSDPLNFDSDSDGVWDGVDNCPNDPNTNQTDFPDEDRLGDVCDSDDDNDGLSDEEEIIPGKDGFITNPLIADTDADGLRDGLELSLGTNPLENDSDGDGFFDSVDNCPTDSSVDQTDTDGDLLGDICDINDDDDAVIDVMDNCPVIDNDNQTNTDGDSQGDACDADDDNDGLLDVEEDINGDGTVDVGETDPLEPDSDGDTYLDGEDCNPLDNTVYPGAPEIINDGQNNSDCSADFTVEIIEATYTSKSKTLTVIAVSSESDLADLYLVGYGDMRWLKRSKVWVLDVKKVDSNPGSVQVESNIAEDSTDYYPVTPK